MKIRLIKYLNFLTIIVMFSSCVSPTKVDKHVSNYYNNQLPKQEKRKQTNVIVTSPLVKDSTILSTTVRKTSKVIPLILYISYNFRYTISLNPAIGSIYFQKIANQQYAKWPQKQEGEELVITINEMPVGFAVATKSQTYLLFVTIYKWFVDPDKKDFLVNYKLKKNGTIQKEGNVKIKNSAIKEAIPYGRSLKRTIAENLSGYQTAITNMAKECMEKIFEELK